MGVLLVSEWKVEMVVTGAGRVEAGNEGNHWGPPWGEVLAKTFNWTWGGAEWGQLEASVGAEVGGR